MLGVGTRRESGNEKVGEPMNSDAHNPPPTDSSSWNAADFLPPVAARKSADDTSTVSAPDASSSPACDPAVVGKYTILEAGLAGGMGIVYKVRDADLDRIVALKIIKGGIFATEEAVARFHCEARAAARLNHPNIIPVHEIGQERGCPYFTMAFAWGGSLAQHRKRFADPRAAAALVETIARAVHYAHKNGILHRDLKPANILFDARGTPLVSDFGLAKFVDANLELTQSGQVLGTPSYMAPEQASGQSDQISAQTDVWALGVILYELLTDRRPFVGASQEDQLRKVQTTEPPRPRSLNRSLDRALERVVLKCLEKEPSRRYASAKALADDLARWQRGEPVLAQPPSWPIRAGRAIRRYRAPVLRVVLAAVLLVLAALAWRGVSPSAPPVEEGQRSALEEKLAQLRRGEKVTLLGESGPPVWWRWWPSKVGGGILPDMKSGFRVYAGKQPIMLELLPTAPKHYRLRAQVQHADSRTAHGKVGIYFAHGKCQTKEGITHSFFRVDFNDRFPTLKPRGEEISPKSQVHLTLPIHRERRTALFHQADISCAIARQFTPAGQIEPMPWRTLEVEVAPEWIKTFWEGKVIKTSWWEDEEADGVEPKKVLELASRLQMPGLPIDPRELTLGDGIGLYVEQGIAAFRSVVIEPLP
jgi:eukaryotic-like serine/threonine-protein kinase